ncbi:MAG: glycosyltransferase family 4 protein, partial [Nitrospira sp.]|nr:glycosyltransferase family 4 protein [Nitrospira sp.]
MRRKKTEHDKPILLQIVPWDLSFTGGVNIVAKALSECVIEDGRLDPRYWIADWNAGVPLRMAPGEKISRIRLSQPPLNAMWRIRSWVRFFIDIIKMSFLIRKLSPKCIVAHYASSHYFGIIFLRKMRIIRSPIWVVFHGTDLKSIAESGAAELHVKWLSCADGIVAVSGFLASEWRKLSSKECEVIYNFGAVDRSNKTLSCPISKKYILNVGTFSEVKGQDVLLDAFGRIAGLCSDHDLVLVGRDDGKLSELRKQAEVLGISERVFFFTDVSHDQMSRFYVGATLVVISSRREGHPLVALEAGLFGKPVVGTTAGGVPETLDNGCAGLLVAPEDATSLASAMLRLLDDEALRATLGVRLKALVETKFSKRA